MPSDARLSRTIWLYFGFQFFFSLLFWLPVFYEYQKRIGLNDGQIFYIQSIYYIAFCVLEIPTGMIADQIGRLTCMRAGAFALILSNLAAIFFQSYAGFLVHFLLIALARSFISGASSAYLYDFLDRHQARDAFKEIEGKARAYGLYGKVFCWAVIGFIMEWHLTLPYWLTVGAAVLSLAFAFWLPRIEAKGVGGLGMRELGRRLADVGVTLVRSPYLVLIILQGIATFVLGRIVQVNLFQPILGSKAFSVGSYGLVMSLMTAFEAVGSAYPGWIRRWVDDLQAVYVLTILLAVSLWVVPAAGPVQTLVLLAFFAYVMGLEYPIQRQLINDAIPDSKNRATIMSIESIVDRAVNAWLAALIGDYLQGGRMSEYIVLSSRLTVGSMVVLWLLSFVFVRRADDRG